MSRAKTDAKKRGLPNNRQITPNCDTTGNITCHENHNNIFVKIQKFGKQKTRQLLENSTLFFYTFSTKLQSRYGRKLGGI